MIAGKYLDHVDEVMKIVDDITEEIQHWSFATFIFPKTDKEVPFNKTRDVMAPAMVNDAGYDETHQSR